MTPSFLVHIIVSLISPAISYGFSLPEIQKWCATTFYPKPCVYFLTHDPKYGKIPIKAKPDFFNLTLQLAFDRSINSTKMARGLESKCHKKCEKAAWTVCAELYEKTIATLNRTMVPDPKRPPCGTPTVLSTCLTNLDTCQQQFTDLDCHTEVERLIIDEGNCLSTP